MAQISDEGYRYLQELVASEQPRLVFDLERYRALLKRIEWAGEREPEISFDKRCPYCSCAVKHADYCELAALLNSR